MLSPRHVTWEGQTLRVWPEVRSII